MAWPILSTFVEDAEGPTAARREKWREHFDAYLVWKEWTITKNILKSFFGGPDFWEIISKISTNHEHILNSQYRVVMQLLMEYFISRLSKTYERQKFRQLLPGSGEKLDTFVIRLTKQATHYNFGEQIDSMVEDQLIATTKDLQLLTECLEKDCTLDQLLAIAHTHKNGGHQLPTWNTTSKSDPEPTKMKPGSSDGSILKVNTY